MAADVNTIDGQARLPTLLLGRSATLSTLDQPGTASYDYDYDYDCTHYLALCLSVVTLSLSRARARALTLARRLIYICALEDTIDIPTCWNGVLQSPSVIVSSHLWLSLSRSLTHSLTHSLCNRKLATQKQM